MFSITLGLDVHSQDFIEDAIISQRSEIYKIDVERHHPQVRKDAYTIFDIQKYGVMLNLIPLTKGSHLRISTYLRRGNTIENQLAVARFLHLYELIQKPYEAGKDYYAEFLNEFNTKIGIVYEGNELRKVKLWDLNQEKVEEYAKSWRYMKENPSESIFDENKFFSERYPKWYYNSFKPNLEDYYRFLQQSPLTEHPDFWDWYLNTYLRENFYPFS